MDMSSSKLEIVQWHNRGSMAFQNMKKMHRRVVVCYVFLPIVIRCYDYTRISGGFSQGVFYVVSFLREGKGKVHFFKKLLILIQNNTYALSKVMLYDIQKKIFLLQSIT